MHIDIQILDAWISGVLCFLMLFVLIANSATPEKTYSLAQSKEAQHSVTFSLVMTLFTFGFSVMAIMMGYILGDRSTTRLPSLWAGTISGLLMISIEIYEYFIG